MLLDRRVFFVKERVGFLKLANRYDIFDSESGEQIGFAQEEVDTWVKVFRLLNFFSARRSMLRTKVVVKENVESEPVLTLEIRRPRIEIIDQHQKSMGFLISKLFNLGGGFTVHSPSGDQIADVQGNWKGWDFKLIDMNGNELGSVNKKWAGALKEIFTTADNYAISLHESVDQNSGQAALLLAAGIAIDIVFKEFK